MVLAHWLDVRVLDELDGTREAKPEGAAGVCPDGSFIAKPDQTKKGADARGVAP